MATIISIALFIYISFYKQYKRVFRNDSATHVPGCGITGNIGSLPRLSKGSSKFDFKLLSRKCHKTSYSDILIVIEEPNLIRGDTYLAPRSEKKYSSRVTSEDGDSGCGDLATFRKWRQIFLGMITQGSNIAMKTVNFLSVSHLAWICLEHN